MPYIAPTTQSTNSFLTPAQQTALARSQVPLSQDQLSQVSQSNSTAPSNNYLRLLGPSTPQSTPMRSYSQAPIVTSGIAPTVYGGDAYRTPMQYQSPTQPTINQYSFGALGQSNAPWSSSDIVPLLDRSYGLTGKVDEKLTGVTQTPFNVFQGAPDQISQLLSFLMSSGVSNPSQSQLNPNYGRSTLGNQYFRPEDLDSALRGGIDFFGRQGISEGIQNINAQANQANARLSNTLGRRAGNEGILSVLQNQNLFKSQLGALPLYAEAQRGTLERSLARGNLVNQIQNQLNQNQLQQLGFNRDQAVTELNARNSYLQPVQNILELLSSLQGQARGVSSGESAIGRSQG